MLLILPVLILSSCVKGGGSSNGNNTQSIEAIVKANSTSMTLYQSLLVRTGLDATFSQGGPYTVFASTDNAFSQVGYTSANLANLSDSQVRSIILYGAYAANAPTSSLPVGPNAKVITMGGDSIFVSNNGNGIYINGIQLVQGDVLASNGILDMMNGVLQPPTGNFTQKIAQADTSLSFAVAAIARASTGKTNIGDLLSNHGPYTFFLPDNDAWRAGGYPTIAAINAQNADTLANILEYHMVSGRIFTSDMLGGATPVGLNQEPFTISTPTITGNTISGKKNTTKGNLIFTNVMVRNGVLHVINILLAP
jgi:uncharacterized surface protein with fasciclin (FAS1) repeats